MKTRTLLLHLILLLTGGPVFSSATNDSTSTIRKDHSPEQESSLQQKAFTMETGYLGDVCTNMAGGIRTGTVYIGMANLKIGFDTRMGRLWRGGQFFINGAATHGQSPTDMLTGDFQVVSNIDAGDHIYMHELWYKHTFPRFEITIGLQDLNVEFAGSENGSLFINSSFGIPPVISDNIPAPVFPLTAPGITGKLKLSDAFTFSGAVYDGCPTAFEHNLYNTRWHLNADDGNLLMTELQWTGNVLRNTATCKAGYYHHSGLMETDGETGEKTEVFDKNYGFYFIADQTVWKANEGNRNIGLFAQVALSPPKINNHYYYFGGGITLNGISKRQAGEAMGIAFASAGFHQPDQKNETTLEFFYRKQISDNLFVQPDLQYIIHPSGSDVALSNSLLGIFRFSLTF
ncbi:MAG: carbohydrate porin [Lentimicrobium sp.]